MARHYLSFASTYIVVYKQKFCAGLFAVLIFYLIEKYPKLYRAFIKTLSMKKLLVILLVTTSVASAQDWPVKSFVTNKKEANIRFVDVPAFKRTGTQTIRGRGVYEVLQLDAAFQKTLLAEQPDAIRFSLPISNTEIITCELVKFSIGNIKITTNDIDSTPQDIVTPLSYRGIVVNENRKHNVVLSVNKNHVSLFAALSNKVVQLTKADETNRLTYRLYNSARLQFPSQKINCGTRKESSTPLGRMQNGLMQPRTMAVTDKCVNVFVECFDSLWRWQGASTQQTTDYVYELFGLVATGYANDSINILVSAINIWTTMDPYRQMSRDSALADLANRYKDNFWGNICVGLDYSTTANGRSGLAGDIGRVKGMAPGACPAFVDDSTNQFCYNDMNYFGNYLNFPTGPNTQPEQTYLVMHEIGHLLGSPHTQWCGWVIGTNPTVMGALDHCAPVENGPCSNLTIPSNAGTIMSYCNSAPDTVNYNNGFGPQPGTAIRNFVSNSTCIPTCFQCVSSLHKQDNDLALKKKEGMLISRQRKRTPSP